MADSSSKPDPVAGWKKRVYEAQQDLQFVEEEKRQLLEDVKSLERMTLKEKEAVRQEKLKLAKRLEETERIGNELEAQCEKQSAAKILVETVYQQALDEYDRLHDVVKKVKAKEKECEQRTDFDAVLQSESYDWAEEEHRLRTKMNALQTQVRDMKQKQQDAIVEAEARLRDAEARLHSDRMGREVPTRASVPAGANHRAAYSNSAARQASTSLAQGGFSDESILIPSSAQQPQQQPLRTSLPAPILMNKSASRKRDHLGDVTNH